MDTLPTDLQTLIDNHISYIEETLLFYTSNYQQGVDPKSWKNFIHHLHISNTSNIYLDIFEHCVINKDYIGCLYVWQININTIRLLSC